MKTESTSIKKHWIEDLKRQHSFSSSVDFFVKTARFPILYFEYRDSQAWLLLKQSAHLAVNNSICFRLHELDSTFNPVKLYNPKKIPVFHTWVQKLFGTPEYQYFPLIFNKKVIAVFVYLSDSSVVQNQLFILNNYLKDFLWREKWEKESSVDALTGCLNQKFFLKQLFIEFSRARRLSLPLSLILLQLDRFEELKSAYGSYKTGIFIKSLLNNLIRDSRSYDIFGSWSNGHLGIILPHTSERAAGMKAEKVRWSVQSADFSKVFSSHGRLTLSLGAAEYPRVGRSADNLFHSTSKALFFAHKECGGNITALATPATGFKPDFSVPKTMTHQLRDLT